MRVQGVWGGVRGRVCVGRCERKGCEEVRGRVCVGRCERKGCGGERKGCVRRGESPGVCGEG